MNILARLHQRVLNALGIGSTTAASQETGGVQSLQIRIFGAASATKDPVPSLQDFGLASGIMPGAHVAVLHLGGDPTKAVVVASNDPRYRPDPAAGETILFNAFGMQVALAQSGITVEANNEPVTVNAATTVTINAATDVIMNTPTLKVSGDIVDNYQTNPHTMADMRTLYDEHDHQVPGVQAGSDTLTTSTPTPQE